MWIWPLHERPRVPAPGEPGAFGAVRKHDVHTGVDLYCVGTAPVFAVETGVVCFADRFTGPNAGSPWWLETFAIGVRGPDAMVLYGELTEASCLLLGKKVRQGDLLGHTARVLKHDKGLSTTMLHFELYEQTVSEPMWWRSGTEKPRGLLDPTDLLLQARGEGP